MTVSEINTIACAATATALAAFVYYAVSNASGHTGFNPQLAGIVFLLPLGFSYLNIAKKGYSPFLHGFFVLSLAGALFGLFLDSTQILMNYEAWLTAGQPARDEADMWFWLILYFGFYIAIWLLVWQRKAARANSQSPE